MDPKVDALMLIEKNLCVHAVAGVYEWSQFDADRYRNLDLWYDMFLQPQGFLKGIKHCHKVYIWLYYV